jgi:hypothetical protein
MGKANEDLRQQVIKLQRQKLELEAQLAHVYHFASHGLAKADTKRTIGSGVLVQLHYLGGAEVCLPFVIKDGFSDETITGLLADLRRSYEKTIEFKPRA